jgi:quinol monooxygenase YgiN
MAQSDEIQVFAAFSAQPGRADELRGLMTALAPQIRGESGCLHFTLHEAENAPGNFHIFEIFSNQAAAEAHRNSAHITSAAVKITPLLAREPTAIYTKQIA